MRLSLQEALQKAARYCARQERSHSELRDKLYQWGVFGEEAEDLIADLITNNYLSESRFAEAYVIGKFRQKHWGRRKIRQGLKQKRVPEQIIQDAMQSIPEDEYEHVLLQVVVKRSRNERATDPFIAKQRIIKYLVQRGFEPDIARRVLEEHT